MSVLIKGITAGELMHIFEWARIGANNCMIGHGVVATELLNHGDLIDRDVVLDTVDLMMGSNRLFDAYNFIESCEAVIEAERSEE